MHVQYDFLVSTQSWPAAKIEEYLNKLDVPGAPGIFEAEKLAGNTVRSALSDKRAVYVGTSRRTSKDSRESWLILHKKQGASVWEIMTALEFLHRQPDEYRHMREQTRARCEARLTQERTGQGERFALFNIDNCEVILFDPSPPAFHS